METRNLVTSLVLYEAITTTKAKAKTTASLFERVINIGKKGGVTARRELKKILLTVPAEKKVVEDLAKRFGDLKSGYTHQFKLGNRKGDNAPLIFLKFTREKPVIKENEKKTTRRKT